MHEIKFYSDAHTEKLSPVKFPVRPTTRRNPEADPEVDPELMVGRLIFGAPPSR